MSPRPAVVAHLPELPGVYRFRDAHDEVLYLGRAVKLRRRVGSYWGDLGDRGRLAAMIPRIARIEVLACDSEHEAAWAERNLLEHSLPPWNRTRGGEESPVYIRFDSSVGSPGLSPAFRREPREGVRYFGPYLGGQKVRFAISALLRVYPLDYAGTRLTASESELAQLRHGGSAARQDLVAAIVGVLERAPRAVAAFSRELTSRRDAAAEAHWYELAARLQKEIGGIEWVVAPQRVTGAGSGACDPCAWTDGVQVSFEVRGGRLVEWTQGPSSHAGSGVSASRTWAAFVQRNAELAAALAPYQIG